MIRVTAAVIEKEGRVLIARRKPGGPFGDLWEFPGGKIEANETPEQCLERELWEELGIQAEAGPLLCVSRHDYGHLAVELLAYRVRSFTGEVRALEHAETRWVRSEQLADYDFPEADRPIIRELAGRSPRSRSA